MCLGRTPGDNDDRMTIRDETATTSDALAQMHDRLEAISTQLWRSDRTTGRFIAEATHGTASSDDESRFELLQGTLQQSRITNELAPGFESARILGPVHGEHPAVIEIVLEEPVSDPNRRAEILADFIELCDQLSEADTGRDQVLSAPEFAHELPRSVLRLHRSLNVRDTADIGANETVYLSGCDRAAIATRHGARVRIVAVSGQESPRSRARQIKALGRLCAEVLKANDPLIYTGDVSEHPPAIRERLTDYLHESRVTMLVVRPLIPPQGLMDAEVTDQRPKVRRPIGAIIAEQQTGYSPRPMLLERTNILSQHLAVALSNSTTFSRIPFARLLTTLGRLLSWFRGRRKWLAIAILAALVGTGLALAFVPWTYHVSATGRLMPVVRQDVFAPDDATVLEVKVDDGQSVSEGEVLIVLRSDQLEQAFVTASNTCDEKSRVLHVLQARLATAERLSLTDQIPELNAEISRTRVEQLSANETKAVLESRLESLLVRAPFSGRVVGFRMKQALASRPVARGERLIEVIQPGRRRLELQIPEYRMGHVESALANTADGALPVNYLLASDVDSRRQATLTKLATRVDESAESGTVVLGFADVEESTVTEKHLGADVEARIDCGPKSLGYVLFGDLVEFAHRHLWWL